MQVDFQTLLSGLVTFKGTGNFTFSNETGVVVKKAVGAATTVTLPLISADIPTACIVQDGKGDAASNNITVQGASGQTIDGSATYVMSTAYQGAWFISNGTEWNILSVYGPAASGGAPGTFTTLTLTGLLTEAAGNALTAVGTTQGTALALTKQINNVGTAANATAPFNGVTLPASAAGLEIEVINSSANPIQVYGAGTDTINGVATATGVTQPPNSVVEYSCTAAGAWFAEGIGVGFSAGFFTEFSVNGITAFAGGGQGSATLLTGQTNRVTTVATRADSVKLPVSAAGLELVVINSGAAAMAVFPQTGDTINGQAANVSVLQMPNSINVYSCAVAGGWHVEAGGGYSGSFITELSEDTITAFAGGGQGSARLLTAQTSRVTVVATTGDSIKLPVSAAGLELMVINHGANAMQVYGSGTDTIDDVATATGVSQMANSLVIYSCATAGAWYSEGLATGFGGAGLQTMSFTPSITAFSGGGQGSAVALTSMINRVAVVAAQGDSVKLPASTAGLTVTIINKGVNACQVFGAGTDTINGIATATGIAQGINTNATYICSVAGNWEVPISSLVSPTPQALSVNGAIPSHVSHTYVITKAGVLADTLGAPTAGTDDGLEIVITSDTANAHTLTATGLLDTGSANVNVATFAAFKGAGLTLMAYNGRWKVLSQVGITFS